MLELRFETSPPRGWGEVATILAIAEGTARKRGFDGLQALRALLERDPRFAAWHPAFSVHPQTQPPL